MLKPKPEVLAAPRYQPALRNTPDPATAIYVDANESALGPSQAARAAGIAAAANPERYPDGLSTALRKKIGVSMGIDPAFIVCGHGSEELIHMCCRALLAPGDEIICGKTAFAIYRIATLAAGGRVVDADETDFVLDPKSVAAKLSPRTRIVFVANPNNPTGALIGSEAMDALRHAIPPEVLLVLDTAYAEYVTAPGYSAGHEWVSTDGNVAVMRTFSKAHGLAAMRVGWLHGPAALVDALDRVRPVFNVPTPSQAAAEAAFGDEGHLDAVRAHAARSIAAYRAAADRLPPMKLGWTNFVFFPHAPGLTDHLLAENIVAFSLRGYGLPDAARVTFGTDEENARVIDAIAGWPGPNA
jgi:histidinol-phosphate aminotransferase